MTQKNTREDIKIVILGNNYGQIEELETKQKLKRQTAKDFIAIISTIIGFYFRDYLINEENKRKREN